MSTKYALVPIADGTEELEATAIITVLRRAGVNVTVLSINQPSGESIEQPDVHSLIIEGARHFKIVADKSIAQSSDQSNQTFDQSIFPESGHFDAIVLPGGIDGSKRFSECAPLNNLLINQANNQRLIAALCAAPATVLSPLKLIRRKAIGHPVTLDTLKDSSGRSIYQSVGQMMAAEPVIFDESINVITAVGAGHSVSFALACVHQLVGEEKLNEVKKAMCLFSTP